MTSIRVLIVTPHSVIFHLIDREEYNLLPMYNDEGGTPVDRRTSDGGRKRIFQRVHSVHHDDDLADVPIPKHFRGAPGPFRRGRTVLPGP